MVSVLAATGGVVQGADVAEGGLLWLQGYDGDPPPPRPGFTVYGTLRLESIDDSQSVGLVIPEGGLTNAPGGEVWIGRGAGGGRYIAANFINQGAFNVRATAFLSGRDTRIDNTGSITITPFNSLNVNGKGAQLSHLGGSLELGGRFELRDAQLSLLGGNLTYGIKEQGSELVLARSALTVAAAFPDPVRATFVGLDSRLQGAVRSSDTLLLLGNAVYGSGSLRWEADPVVRGQLLLDSGQGAFGFTLEAPAEGLEIGTDGILEVRRGTGGARSILGDVAIHGRAVLATSLTLGRQTRPALVGGALEVLPTGSLTSPAGILQTSGSVVVDDGRLISESGMRLVDAQVLGGSELDTSVTNAGVIRVRPRNGAPLVVGDWTQEPECHLEVAWGSESVGTADSSLLTVTGAFLADGTLQVAPDPDQELSAGLDVVLIAASEVRGWFKQVRLPELPSGLRWQIADSENQVRARIVSNGDPGQVQITSRPDGLRVGYTSSGVQDVIFQGSSDLTRWVDIRRIDGLDGYAEVFVEVPVDVSPSAYFVRAVPVSQP